jgi:uncharacterized protein YkwD
LLALVTAAGGAAAGDARTIEDKLFIAVNRERQARRVPALAWSDELANQARRHSEAMDRRNFFGHRDPERGRLSDRLRAAGIAYKACAENLYQQSGLPDPAAEAVRAWLRSRGHRSNLLSRVYRSTGVGVAVSSGNRYTVTQVFLA